MLYLLIVISVQHGITDLFFTEYTSRKACIVDKKEALLHDNEVTKIRAYCIKQEK